MPSRALLYLVAACLLAAPVAAADRAEAEAAVAVGIEAMREAELDPRRGVDAALAFSQALTVYKALGDQDAVCEMQANIYWCKKRMNLDDLQAYVAKKGGAAQQQLTVAREVIEREVPVAEADAYLARARDFQAKQPDKHFLIAIRYSEIIERFPDTEAARVAGQVFAKEQSLYLAQVAEERQRERAQLQDELRKVRSTRFMRPPPAVKGSTAIPDAAEQARAQTAVKEAYRDSWGARGDGRKRALARKLYAESDQNREDAAFFYVLLDESARLALESGDWEQLLTSIEKQGETFVGFDVQVRKRELLTRARADLVAAAILTLLNDPKEPRANLVAGKAFCFSIQRWDLGLPMLCNGDDTTLAKTAELELSGPRDANEQRAMGDAWHAAGRPAGGQDRIAMWQRAQHWYRLALPGLTGINQKQTQKRLDELEDALPLGEVDLDQLTVKQWHKLKGKVVEVPGKVDRSNGVVALTPEYRVRAVPHPDDRGKMRFQVGNPAESQDAGVLTGNGQLWIIPTTGRRGADDRSLLRVKLVEVE